MINTNTNDIQKLKYCVSNNGSHFIIERTHTHNIYYEFYSINFANGINAFGDSFLLL